MFPTLIYQRSFLTKSLLKNDTSAFTVCVLKSYFSQTQAHQTSNHVRVEESSSKVFFSQPAQKLMKKITGFDVEKINRARTRPGQVKAPLLKFMTTEMLEIAQKKAMKESFEKLQIPPLLPINDKEPEILDNDPNVIGCMKTKIVFTDITYNVSDRKRLVVVREPNGILRKATPFEKHRMNQLYFPRFGREYKHPRMFRKENLEPLWEKGEYEFILDRACCQFEPDDPEFHEVTFETFRRINERKAFDVLRSTRHYGTLVFYLCLNKNLNNLLKENLETDRLQDAILTIKLYQLIHPNCKFNSLQRDSEDKLKFLQAFVETEMVNAEPLKLLLENMIIQADKDKQLVDEPSDETKPPTKE